ncbi:MAG: 16S rRNA (cytosine(1402)-N(4))-methyltransferase RsmH [Candidatus Kapabacteria bacterium]|nr:16S rRNA (cytosine(1402)-N(4))-methyltransferase RsmH [Candidatus Kapabacteria bacterium]MDW8225364.1 16S rRNA (cytosine(1402)-N(4))-methyltransferase RsmH [Bacteroidota bacterium]
MTPQNHQTSLSFHEPVMVREALELWFRSPDGIYVDGTLGSGGHTAALLKRLSPEGHIVGMDIDPNAIAYCQQRFATELQQGRLRLIRANFRQACEVLHDLKGKVQGFLLDLGLSWHQVDTPERGFTFRARGPLDMRFGPDSPQTAEALLAAASEEELASLLRRYGEEPRARVLARRIVQRRRSTPLRTTADLRAVVEEVVPPPHRLKSLARVFQALRIAVNDELGALREALECAPHLLAPTGRIVVISYHSLEDRIVKEMFRQSFASNMPLLRILTPKPLRPSAEEIQQNPRARSARLRAAERLP